MGRLELNCMSVNGLFGLRSSVVRTLRDYLIAIIARAGPIRMGWFTLQYFVLRAYPCVSFVALRSLVSRWDVRPSVFLDVMLARYV